MRHAACGIGHEVQCLELGAWLSFALALRLALMRLCDYAKFDLSHHRRNASSPPKTPNSCSELMADY